MLLGVPLEAVLPCRVQQGEISSQALWYCLSANPCFPRAVVRSFDLQLTNALLPALIQYRVRVISAVRMEDGEEVDRELWVLLEELQERKQALAAENTALRARTPTGSWKCAPAAIPLTLFSNGHRSHCQSGERECCP